MGTDYTDAHTSPSNASTVGGWNCWKCSGLSLGGADGGGGGCAEGAGAGGGDDTLGAVGIDAGGDDMGEAVFTLPSQNISRTFSSSTNISLG